ncbi:MAG: dihydrofolate reductase [Nocardioides sp.]
MVEQSRGRLTLIAAYADNRVIGDHGTIPWRIPDDFAHFKATTMGGTLVMGRATYDSIGRPLPGRTTVVVTRNPDWSADGVSPHDDASHRGGDPENLLVAHSLDDALALADQQPGEVYVAGGAQIYAQALPHATHQILTEVHQSPDGDAHYPEFALDVWVETRREKHEVFDWVWRERR